MYLGEDEILECYLGTDAIAEAYLGEELVFSTGPFVGLKFKPDSIILRRAETGDTGSLWVKSSEDWTLSTNASWFTISPTSGLGTGEKAVITVTVTDVPTGDTSDSISCITQNYSASTVVNYLTGYSIPANEIWYATENGQPITSLNRWNVYDKSGVKMASSVVSFSTYGKFVFPRDIGYVAGNTYETNNNWVNLVELGLPEMDPTLCISSNDFGFSYCNNYLPYWRRVYGDYQYINKEETMAWGSDGGGVLVAKGVTGKLVLPEGLREISAYGLDRVSFSEIEFPTTFTGITGLQQGIPLGQYALEDARYLTSIKYKTMTAPNTFTNSFSRVNQQGTAYYPTGATGYGNNHKPTNFTWDTY